MVLGLHLKPTSIPPRVFFRNHNSADEHELWLTKELATWVEAGHIRCVDRSFAHMIHPISVVAKKVAGKWRIIIDCRLSNALLPHFTFRMPTLEKNLGDVVRFYKVLFIQIA